MDDVLISVVNRVLLRQIHNVFDVVTQLNVDKLFKTFLARIQIYLISS